MRSGVCASCLVLGLILTLAGASKVGAAPSVAGMSLNLMAMTTTSAKLSTVQSVPAASARMVPASVSAPAQVQVPAQPSAPLEVAVEKMMMVAEMQAMVVITPPDPLTNPEPEPTTPPPPQPTYSVVTERPDYAFNQAGLNFQERTTITMGQIGIGVGPGLETGVVRYVPVGEF